MFLVLVVLSVYCTAQVPQKFSYQAVIRNSNGDLVTDNDVGVRITILQGSPTGVPVWIETYSPNPHTNDNGLVTIEIGESNPLSIDFSSGGPYFLKTETDPSGGTDYTISGTSELLSVPYALHAKTVASYTETQNLTNVLTLGTDGGDNKIVNISQVGIGTATPAASAAVEINSTTQGFLLPRMTSEQINALTPVEGLLVYNTTSDNLTYYGNGKWYELTNKVCFPDPTPANAGPDNTVGTTSTNLAGNTPVFGTGTWTIVEGAGGIIADIHNPASVFTGTLGAGYVLKWTISTPCSSSADNVIISLGPTCSNGIMDGPESDVDCGGGCPDRCQYHCWVDTDCVEPLVCFGGGSVPGECVLF